MSFSSSSMFVSMVRLSVSSLFAYLLAMPCFGDVLYSGGDFFDSMDGLPTANSFNALDNWVDDSTLPGWYRLLTTDGSAAGVENRFRVDNGSAGGGSLWSLGAFGSSERALGVTTSTNIPVAYFGLRLRNVSQQLLTSLNIGYTGEQWRKGGEGFNKLQFSWSTNATSLTTGDWNFHEALDFRSVHEFGLSGPLDGNDSANQRRISDTIAGLAWGPDETLWLRWTGNDRPNGDDTLAVDDLHFSSVPEPSSLLLSVLSLLSCLVGHRRYSCSTTRSVE